VGLIFERHIVAFAEIDWHDYAIVQTIEFTAADAAAELPPPMSVQEVENMTLAQKRMAAMVMETTVEDVEAHRARQAAAEAEAAFAVGNVGGGAPAEAADDDVMMEESDDEDTEVSERKKKEEEERQKELERAKAIQASSLEAGAPMKIRTDYVPKCEYYFQHNRVRILTVSVLVGTKSKVALTTCSICGQQIPVNELQEHMRIELLDPRWKSQRDALEARKAQASELQRGANVVSSLKNLARTRVDIFGTETDEERRKREEEEERERRKEREKVVWDGHTATKAGTLDKYSTNVNFDEQIAAIHRAKGLGPYVLSLHLMSYVKLRSSLQTRFERYWPRHRPCSGAASSCPRAASTPYPSKTCRRGAQRSLIYCCNNIVGTTACVDVSHTCTTCYASSTPLSGIRLGTALRLSASASPRRSPASIQCASRTTAAKCCGHGSPC